MDDAGAGERAPGLKPAAARLAAGVLELIRTRLELASVELAEERERLKALAVLAIAGAVLATLAVATISILVVAYFWDTYRYAAIVGLAVVYAVLAALAFSRAAAVARRAPSPFAATIAEFEKDRAALERKSPPAP